MEEQPKIEVKNKDPEIEQKVQPVLQPEDKIIMGKAFQPEEESKTNNIEEESIRATIGQAF